MSNKQPLKEAFFRNALVPTGQMLELALLIARRIHQGGTRTTPHYGIVGNVLRDTLNMVSVWAVNPASTDLQQVEQSLAEFREMLCAVFREAGGSQGPMLLGLFRERAPALSSVTLKKLTHEHVSATARLLALQEVLLLQIGCVDSQRHQWIRGQLAVSTPLTRGGRMNRWRTFVRNGSWEVTLGLLGVSALVRPDELVANCWGTNVGVTYAKELWQETFNTWNPTAAAAPEESEELSAKLPAGVRVTSTPTGTLEVTACFVPGSLLTKEQLSLITPRMRMHVDLASLLVSQDFSRTCSFLLLADAVAEAQAWLTERRATADSVCDTFKAFEQERRRELVIAKFRKTFSLEEQQLLESIYAAKPSTVRA